MQELFEQQGLSQTVANAEQMKHFKNVVRSLMEQAEGILGELQMTAEGKGVEEKIAMLDHCLDYTRRLCEYDPSKS